jgi:hypothetical protein
VVVIWHSLKEEGNKGWIKEKKKKKGYLCCLFGLFISVIVCVCGYHDVRCYVGKMSGLIS